MNTTVLIFAKEPRAGRVKTRLEPAVGAEAAARLAHGFLVDTAATAATRRWASTVVVYDGDVAKFPAGAGACEVWPQGDGDLGERMQRAFERALSVTSHAIALGTDSPGLPVDRLDAAYTALHSHDAVVGPAEDGGYYLLGLRRCPSGLLSKLPWSRRDTARSTMDRLRERGLSVATLESWFDVDRPEDLARLERLLAARAIDAPATAAVLADLAIATPATRDAQPRRRG